MTVDKKPETAFKKFVARKEQGGISFSKEELDRKKAEYENKDEYKFKIGWYPPEWLVWYCYGPPVALNAHQFGTRQMDHLVQVSATPRGLSHEEELVAIGKADKIVRRTSGARLATLKRKATDEVTSDNESAKQEPAERVVRIVRENAQATLKKSDHLDQAIQAKSAQIKLLVEMGMDALKINEAREELLKLLQTKYEISLNAFDTAM